MDRVPEPLKAGTRDVAADRGSEPLPLARVGAGFKRGRGVMLLGLLGALALGLAGLWELLSHDDEARVYGELGRKINGIRLESFDDFWECALEGVDFRAVRNNAELTGQLRRLTQGEGGRDYALHLREDCATRLEPIAPQLAELIVPPDLQADVTTLQRAATQLSEHLSSWLTCLERGDAACDQAERKPALDGIARSWFEFQTAHAAINKTLKLRLEKR